MKGAKKAARTAKQRVLTRPPVAIHGEGVSRVNSFFMDPSHPRIVVVGVDHPELYGQDHAAFDPSVLRPPEAREYLHETMRNPKVRWFGEIEVMKDGEYLIVTKGRRRTLAAREVDAELEAAGLDRFKIRLRPERREREAVFDGIIAENYAREETDPINEAWLINRALHEMGMTPAELEGKIHKGHEEQQRRLRLLDLHPDVQQMVRDGKVSVARAIDLSAFRRDEQMRILREEREQPKERRPSCRSYRRLAREALQGQIKVRGVTEDFWKGVLYGLNGLDEQDVPKSVASAMEQLRHRKPAAQAAE